jgi:hypothetical protein
MSKTTRTPRQPDRHPGEDVSRTMLPRPAAAKYLGLQETTLRDWWASGDTGPAGVKLGTSRQARVFYPVAELDAWKTDPIGYSRRARPESIGPFEPPRRGDKRGPTS